MRYQYIPYMWPLFISAFSTFFLGAYSLIVRRKARGALSFILSMFVLTIWSSANAMEMASFDLSTKLFWANVQYFAYCYSPVTLLGLCMEFTGYDQWVHNKKVLWLAVLPTIILILVWTNEYHGLIRYGMHMDYNGAFPVIAKKYGPAFYVHALYSQGLNIAAGVLLIKAVFYKNSVYRKQAMSLFFGLCMIVVPNIMYILGISPISRFDITPLTFGPAGLIAAWGIFRYKLFDVVPVAWSMVIKNMEGRVLVTDLQDRVLEMNPSLERMLGCTTAEAAGKPLEEVGNTIPEFVGACLDRDNIHREFSTNKEGVIKHYEVILSPIRDDRGVIIGRLAVIHNVTKRRQEQQEYIRQQWKQAVTMERERHARDMHDNLGQVLGFISLQAQGVKQELETAGVGLVSGELDKLVAAAQTANSDIREYIRRARNENTEEDFVTALKKLVSGFEDSSGINTKLSIPPDFSWERLSTNTRIHILNIVREAMNNIRKHAAAENVCVMFSIDEEFLRVEIKDDGRGFDTGQQDASGRKRFGLSIMQERALEIDARIEIQSANGEGSCITLLIPMKEVRENE